MPPWPRCKLRKPRWRKRSSTCNNTVITSPVNGTVVAREVSVGQTVAASLAAPTLFSIAQNLAKMEVDINVGEPDIGGIVSGNTVTFTVLAYPKSTFTGNVTQVRINPQTLNNVVTYDVVVDVANPNGTLLPGMTANATIDTASANNALIVPLAALQFGARAQRRRHRDEQFSGLGTDTRRRLERKHRDDGRRLCRARRQIAGRTRNGAARKQHASRG